MQPSSYSLQTIPSPQCTYAIHIKIPKDVIDKLVQQPSSNSFINFVQNDKATLHFAQEEFSNIRMTKEEFRDLYCLDENASDSTQWKQVGTVHKKLLLPTRLDEKFSQSVKTKSTLLNKKDRQTQDISASGGNSVRRNTSTVAPIPARRDISEKPSYSQDVADRLKQKSIQQQQQTTTTTTTIPKNTPPNPIVVPTTTAHLKTLFELYPEMKKIDYSVTQPRLKNTKITSQQQCTQFRQEYDEKYQIYLSLMNVLEKNKSEFEKLRIKVEQEMQPNIKEKLKKDMTDLYAKRKDEVSKMTATYLSLYSELEELKQLIKNFENKQ